MTTSLPAKSAYLDANGDASLPAKGAYLDANGGDDDFSPSKGSSNGDWYLS